MPESPVGLFLPGFAARTCAYELGLPPGWEAAQPPPPRSTRGSLVGLGEWAVNELRARSATGIVAGHSMGGALALLAAAAVPDRVRGLILISPAGLPLQKPLRLSAADFSRQLAARTHPLPDVLAAASELASAPRSAVRLVRALRRLDLSAQMERVRAARIPTVVVACATDTLVTPSHCRSAARLLAAEYRELAVPGGHVWMFERPALLAALLRDTASA